MCLALFWIAVLLITYTYAIFPGIVFLRGAIYRRPVRSAEITPTVSLIIAAHNEAENIGAKLDNVLSLNYPHDRLEVLIASDGSTDETEAIVGSYADRGVRLLALSRRGKASALNAAVASSSGEILVFSDANSMFGKDAVRSLVQPLADPKVGGVAGDQRYLSGRSESVASDGERTYWSFDRKLKQFESRAGNVISATGAIYAIRRVLFRTVPPNVTDDFVTSTNVIAQGYRLVFAPDAIAYEPVAKSGGAEFGRKVRVITRGLRAVIEMRALLNPFDHGSYAIQLFSHKVLRRLVVVPLLLLLFVSPLLWSEGVPYQAAALVEWGICVTGALGAIFSEHRLGRLKVVTIPYFFCMVNAASLMAALNIVRGRRINLWEPQRAEGKPVPSAHAVAVTAGVETRPQ